jgi:hypothetical protein
MAQKTQGAIAAVGTATAATKVITAITAASPPVVSSTAHGYANGDLVFIDSVGGMTQVNKRLFVVANQAANTFELKGVDGTGYSTYTSGGTAAKKTMTTIGECKAFGPGLDGESAELETTNLLSVNKEFLLGLADSGSLAFQIYIPTAADTGQSRLKALRELGTLEAFSVTMPSGQVLALMGLVKSLGISEVGVDGVLLASGSIRVSNAPGGFFV